MRKRNTYRNARLRKMPMFLAMALGGLTATAATIKMIAEEVLSMVLLYPRLFKGSGTARSVIMRQRK